MPFVRRTRATLRSAELGFFGVCVRTLVQTPRFWGLPSPRTMRFVRALKRKRSAGALVFLTIGLRPRLTSWLIVGTLRLTSSPNKKPKACVRFAIAARARVGAARADPSAKSSDRSDSRRAQPGRQRLRIAMRHGHVNRKSLYVTQPPRLRRSVRVLAPLVRVSQVWERGQGTVRQDVAT